MKQEYIYFICIIIVNNDLYFSTIIIFTSICIEHQSISLMMKNLPSPPTFLTIRGKVTCSPTKHSPQSKLFNFLYRITFSVDVLGCVPLLVSTDYKFLLIISLKNVIISRILLKIRK